MILPYKTIQHFLNVVGHYGLDEDGDFAKKSMAAGRDYLSDMHYSNSWPDGRTYVGLEQLFLNSLGAKLLVDGFNGPKTDTAIGSYQHGGAITPPKPAPPTPHSKWPRQKDVPGYFGPISTTTQTWVEVPYMMFADYERLPSQRVKKIQCHKKVAVNLERILARTAEHYSPAEIKKNNLDIFSGSRVVRRITGGTGYSMHSYGVAFDFDAAHNQFDAGRNRATFDEARFEAWMKFWYDEGAINLGKERNYDWMHHQFPGL